MSMTSEPLQRWTKEQVQQWFLAGDYQEYASCFPINGRQLAVLEEKHFIEAIGLIPGACLFADVQRLKPPQQGSHTHHTHTHTHHIHIHTYIDIDIQHQQQR